MIDERYPVGPFVHDPSLTEEKRRLLIDQIAAAPAAMREAVANLDETQLDTPYRTGGWTVRQVVHHVPDSHMNAYARLKLTLTEEAPVIRPYDEAAWATLADSRVTPIETSLVLLESLHERFVAVWRAMSPEDFRRPLTHPDHGTKDADWLLSMYAWHGRHHIAHITALRERMKW